MVKTSNLFVHTGHQFKILSWASFHAFALARFYFSLVFFLESPPTLEMVGKFFHIHGTICDFKWPPDHTLTAWLKYYAEPGINSNQIWTKIPHPRKRLKITKTGKIHIPQFKYSENKFVLLWGKEFWMLPVTGHCRMDRKVRWASLGYRHVRSVWGSAAEWRGLSKDAHWVSHSAGRGYCKGSGALCPPHR